jgi:hypothetical protein
LYALLNRFSASLVLIGYEAMSVAKLLRNVFSFIHLLSTLYNNVLCNPNRAPNVRMIIKVHWKSYRRKRQEPCLRHCLGISMVKHPKPRTKLIQNIRCAYRDSSGHLPAKIQKSHCWSRLKWLRREDENIPFVLSGNRNLVALFLGRHYSD